MNDTDTIRESGSMWNAATLAEAVLAAPTASGSINVWLARDLARASLARVTELEDALTRLASPTGFAPHSATVIAYGREVDARAAFARAALAGNRPEAGAECEHEWVSADNEVISGAVICAKCHLMLPIAEAGAQAGTAER